MADTEVYFLETFTDCNIPVPNTIFVFDEQVNDSWWKWNNLSVTSMIELDQAQDGEHFYAGGGDTGMLTEIEKSGAVSDSGTTITTRWKTRWHDAGSPDMVKIWRAIFINVDQIGSGITVSWETDAGATSGSFTATITKAKYLYDTSTGAYGSNYNDAAGTQAFGAFYNDQIQGTLQYGLNQDAVGRRIQFTFTHAGQETSPRILGYQLYFRMRQGRYETGSKNV